MGDKRGRSKRDRKRDIYNTVGQSEFCVGRHKPMWDTQDRDRGIHKGEMKEQPRKSGWLFGCALVWLCRLQLSVCEHFVIRDKYLGREKDGVWR